MNNFFRQVIYLSDMHTGHLVVLDSASNRSWKVSSAQMKRSNTQLRVRGGAKADEGFVMTFGVNGIALASNKTHVRTRLHLKVVITALKRNRLCEFRRMNLAVGEFTQPRARPFI